MRRKGIYFLEPGDQVSIFSTFDYDNPGKVTISGSVKFPGEFDLLSNFTLNDVILEAGNFTSLTKLINVEVARVNEKNNKKIDFYNFLVKNNIDVLKPGSKNNTSYKNFKLLDGDFITVRPKHSSYQYSFVELAGELLMPGRYVIDEGNEKITDVVERAGGVTDFANLDASTFIRNQQTVNVSLSKIIKYPRSQDNFYLKNGDTIRIGKKTELVIIEGEVNNPGAYKFKPGLSYKNYIKLAGGYTPDAENYQSYVIYPDGTSKKNNFLKLKSPKITDGAKIVVVSKNVVEPFSLTEYVSNLTSIYADLSQAYLLVLLTASRQ